MCGVILDAVGLCKTCTKHPQKRVDKCGVCGGSRSTKHIQFLRNGNWCRKCLQKINRKVRGYDGAIPYDVWLDNKLKK